MSSGGKGSKPRPFSVSQEKFGNNWDKIFSNKNEDTSTKRNETDQTSKSFKSGELVVPGLQQDSLR